MKHLVTVFLTFIAAIAPVHAQDAVEIVFNGSTATYTIPSSVKGVSIGKNGAKVTVTCTNTTTEYTYRVSGSSDNGSLTINADYKLTLQLAGLTLTNAKGGATIDVECGKRIDVVLEDGTVNTIADSNLGSQKAAFYTKGHAEFSGGGTLNVTGLKKHAICTKEYCELKANTGTINILGALGDGIHCGKGKVKDENNYFLMKGGTLNIAGIADDGIDSDDYGTLTIEDGTVSISVPDGGIGLKADSTVTISGGKVSIDVPGQDSKAIRANYAVNIAGGENTLTVSGDGSKGIKGNKNVTGAKVLNGGNVNISGGVTSIIVSGGNIITSTDGVADTTKCMGISVDANLTQTDGTVTITLKGSEARSYNVKGTETLSGGTLTVVNDDVTVLTGDVNNDGTVDVADISSIINHMAGNMLYDDADVNADGTVDIADISAVIRIMAEQ